MAFTEDFNEFVNDTTYGFAESVTVTIGVTPSTVKGIFRNPYEQVDIGIDGMEASDPAFECKASDVTNIAQGDTVERNSVTYEVIEVMPDGTGWMVLRLRQQ